MIVTDMGSWGRGMPRPYRPRRIPRHATGGRRDKSGRFCWPGWRSCGIVCSGRAKMLSDSDTKASFTGRVPCKPSPRTWSGGEPSSHKWTLGCVWVNPADLFRFASYDFRFTICRVERVVYGSGRTDEKAQTVRPSMCQVSFCSVGERSWAAYSGATDSLLNRRSGQLPSGLRGAVTRRIRGQIEHRNRRGG